MPTAIGSILRTATREPDGPLRIITFPTHERYSSLMGRLPHQFYLVHGPNIKTWNDKYHPIPDNHYRVKDADSLHDQEYDVVLAQHKFGQQQLGAQIAFKLHIPLIVLEHTLPLPTWPREQLQRLKSQRGHVNVFISEYSRAIWGWGPKEAIIVKHGVDTELFSPFGAEERQNVALSVVNDWINRDWCCGYKLWEDATRGLPRVVVGDTPGLSKPAESVEHLAQIYRSCSVFVNTSLVSPIPTSLLEAMASSCAVISTGTAMIPEVIRHGHNGFLANNARGIREYTKILLDDPKLARKMGDNARQTILESFGSWKFVDNWDRIFRATAAMPFLGAP